MKLRISSELWLAVETIHYPVGISMMIGLRVLPGSELQMINFVSFGTISFKYLHNLLRGRPDLMRRAQAIFYSEQSVLAVLHPE